MGEKREGKMKPRKGKPITLCLSNYLSVCVCSTITVCTFIVGGKPHRDNTANFEKVNHRRILNIQRSNL